MSRKLGAFDPASTASTTVIGFSTTDSFTRLVLNFNNSATDAGPNSVTVSTGGGQYTSTAKFGTHSLDGDVNFPVGTFDIDSSLWTLECFLYQTGRSSNNGQAQSVVSSWGGSDSERRYRIHCDNGYVGFSASPDGFNFYGNIVDSGQIPLNTWQHCAWQRNGTVINIFRNGSIVATGSAGAINPVNAHVVGKSNNGNFNFNGYIDDLRILHGINLYTSSYTVPTSELTKDIVATSSVVDTRSHSHVWNYPDIYKARRADTWPSNTFDTRISLYLPFDEDFRDLSSYGHTASSAGGASIQSSIKQHGAGSLLLNGTDEYVTIPNHASFQFGSGDFTIEMWIYMTSNAGSDAGDRHALVARRDSDSNRSFHIGIQSDSGQQKLQFSHTTTGSGGTQTNYDTDIQLNTWTNIAVVREGSSVLAFVDGTKNSSTHSIGSDTIFAGTSPLTIGFRNESSQYFPGYIDDLRITKGLAVYTTSYSVRTDPVGGSLTINP